MSNQMAMISTDHIPENCFTQKCKKINAEGTVTIDITLASNRKSWRERNLVIDVSIKWTLHSNSEALTWRTLLTCSYALQFPGARQSFSMICKT